MHFDIIVPSQSFGPLIQSTMGYVSVLLGKAYRTIKSAVTQATTIQV